MVAILAGCFSIGLSGCGGTATAVSSSRAKGVLGTSASSISFGAVDVSTTATKKLTITNTGASSIEVTALQCSGSAFSVAGASNLPVTLSAGGSYQVTVQFAPTAAGAASGTLSIASSYSTNPTVSVSLTGTGESTAAVTPTLSVSSGSIAFGDVQVNTTATQTISLSSTGNSAVTVSSVTLSGSGFSVSGQSFPLVLNPQQTATLDVAFTPAAAGAVTGNMVISSNSSGGATAIVSLTGTGVAGSSSSYKVQLTWDAPDSSADPVVGYYIYRSVSGASNYQVLNSSSDAGTSYEDTTVADGQSYDYIVKSVDAAGNLSVPSNVASAVIP